MMVRLGFSRTNLGIGLQLVLTQCMRTGATHLGYGCMVEIVSSIDPPKVSITNGINSIKRLLLTALKVEFNRENFAPRIFQEVQY